MDTSSSEPTLAELPTLGKPIRVGELARRTGKTVRALHLYEELDLLHPVHRSKGGFRLYAPSSVARVQWIGKLQDAGFSLQELKLFVQSVLPSPGGKSEPAASSMGRVREVFAQRLAEIRAQMSRLSQLESDLVESLEYLESCRGCRRVEHAGCGTCGEPAHVGKSQPLLVAGIQRG